MAEYKCQFCGYSVKDHASYCPIYKDYNHRQYGVCSECHWQGKTHTYRAACPICEALVKFV